MIAAIFVTCLLLAFGRDDEAVVARAQFDVLRVEVLDVEDEPQMPLAVFVHPDHVVLVAHEHRLVGPDEVGEVAFHASPGRLELVLQTAQELGRRTEELIVEWRSRHETVTLLDRCRR